MNEFEELRYPFLSLGEFVADGYVVDAAAIHLTLGLLFQLAFVVYVFARAGSLVEKSTICFFALSLFNNFAYNIAGVRIGEFFGVIAATAVLARAGRVPFSRRAWVSNALMIGGAVILLHALLIGATYPTVDDDWSTRILRFVLIAKIFVLALVALGVERHMPSPDSLRRLAAGMVTGGVVGCLLYLLQLGLYVGGLTPYGTFWDAGFTGIPSFGSVSIERGHFGKFLVPLFPFFVLLAIERKRRWPLLLLLVVSAINFSASNFVFLVGYIGLAVLFFRRRLLRGRGLIGVPITALACVGIGVAFWTQYQGIIDKIILLAFLGETGGGRGVDVLTSYLQRFPFGTSYGGSTLRTVAGLPEINMGIYTFAAQFAILAIPLALGFGLLNVLVVRRTRGRVDSTVRRALLVGVLMSCVIYAADVLWFIPTIWAPVLLLSRLSQPVGGGVTSATGMAQQRRRAVSSSLARPVVAGRGT